MSVIIWHQFLLLVCGQSRKIRLRSMYSRLTFRLPVPVIRLCKVNDTSLNVLWADSILPVTGCQLLHYNFVV
jgi:hypothetical protein